MKVSASGISGVFFLIAVSLLFCPGCVFLSDAPMADWETREDAEKVVADYERDGTPPPHGTIGGFYAVRSACVARQDPVFEASRTCALLACELSCGENFYTGWIPPAICLPFCLVADVFILPWQACRTSFFPKDRLDLALRDLATARSLGYDKDSVYAGRCMFGLRSTNLDLLGFPLPPAPARE